jgi:hypothetical protein
MDKIADHAAEKLSALKKETTIQLLSFAGLSIAFGIGLYRTAEMYKNNRAKMKNLG